MHFPDLVEDPGRKLAGTCVSVLTHIPSTRVASLDMVASRGHVPLHSAQVRTRIFRNHEVSFLKHSATLLKATGKLGQEKDTLCKPRVTPSESPGRRPVARPCSRHMAVEHHSKHEGAHLCNPPSGLIGNSQRSVVANTEE